ncbi:hypothetical protein [Enhygromyxa salina]|uniref:Uncharacterized protein n=1 Tax=Enhygromyxa salina TaxID=215803 RepID=A0A2S9YS11_9BACT|nr:hypothetical protein [Enhygromyxa salina]PRQ07860.1 hypothetical protein ENSA7_24250 [Enhygromyxa salina]
MAPTTSRTFTESANFDCHWQCAECGFQVPPHPVEIDRHAYRALAEDRPADRRPQHPCEGCGASNTWANLRAGAVVEALITQDETRRSTSGARRSGLVKVAGLLVWGLLGALTIKDIGGWILLPIMAGTAWVMLHAAYVEYASGRRARFANSWRHEPRPRGRTRARLRGRLHGERALRAPLSGRACLAYELGVRHDTDVAADPWTWTLLEQRSAAGLSIDGVAVAQQPYLRLQRRVYTHELSAAARDELRKRGLDPTRPGYTLFETIVEAAEPVTVKVQRTGTLLRGLQR